MSHSEREVDREVDYQVMMLQQNQAAQARDMDEPGFRETYDLCHQFTMTSVERMFDLWKATEYVIRAGVPGDFVECGVWRGGSAMVMLHRLKQLGVSDRRIVLFDTFEGHTQEPDPELDVDIFGGNGRDEFRARAGQPWASSSMDEVLANLQRIQSIEGNGTVLVKGPIESLDFSLSTYRGPIALLRLDLDWYLPTVAALRGLEPRLSSGGSFIADDYGHYLGQRKAIDEYFADKPMMLHRIDYSCRSGIKS